MEHSQDIINECWRSIDGYVNHQVGNVGRVPHTSNGKILSNQRFNTKGYLIVALCKDRIAKNHSVHRLVAEHVIHKADSDANLQVDHIDNDKLNNVVSNLRWVSCQQNMWNRKNV